MYEGMHDAAADVMCLLPRLAPHAAAAAAAKLVPINGICKTHALKGPVDMLLKGQACGSECQSERQTDRPHAWHVAVTVRVRLAVVLVCEC